jgi:hypothetical protein
MSRGNPPFLTGVRSRAMRPIGASIPDYFSDARGESPVSLRSPGDSPQEQTGQRCSAAIEEMALA